MNTAISKTFFLVTLACVHGPALGQDQLDLLEQQAFQAAVERVAPSVVRIQTLGGLEQAGGIVFGTGATSGLVVTPDGYLISSAFNFLNQPDSIIVELFDGTRKPARLVATDHNRMLVLLKIEVTDPLTVPRHVPRDEVRVGAWAIGVGRAFEADRPNMSVGIVSALNRVWGRAIQTDAAVSPNNYGGPLVDLHGRVFGVLVPLSPQAATEVAGVQWYDSGIGFAVPMYDVQPVLSRLKQGEDLHGGLIGVSFSGSNLSTTEPVIAARRPNSPASDAGLQPGDRIIKIDGQEIVRASQVKEQLGRRYAGDKLSMVISRDGREIQRELLLVDKLEPYEHPFLGILPTRTAVRSSNDNGDHDSKPGVAVRYVYSDGPSAKAGIQQGDVLVQLDSEPIQDAAQLRRRISDRKPGDQVQLEVTRSGETRQLQVVLGHLPETAPPDVLPPARNMGSEDKTAFAESNRANRPAAGVVELKIAEFPNQARAYVPNSYDPAARYGIVVWLDAPGQFDWDQLLARWKSHCDRRDLILLAPQSASSRAWQPQEVTLVRKLIDEVKSSYSIDPTRIVVHGQEAGGTLGYLVAFRNRDVVRAVASVEALVVGRPPENEPLLRLAFHAARSEKSKKASHINGVVAHLRQMKYPVTVKDLGEKPRYLSAGELTELVRWIDTLDRI